MCQWRRCEGASGWREAEMRIGLESAIKKNGSGDCVNHLTELPDQGNGEIGQIAACPPCYTTPGPISPTLSWNPIQRSTVMFAYPGMNVYYRGVPLLDCADHIEHTSLQHPSSAPRLRDRFPEISYICRPRSYYVFLEGLLRDPRRHRRSYLRTFNSFPPPLAAHRVYFARQPGHVRCPRGVPGGKEGRQC